eukprot:tig00000970_g5839.t1
MRRAAPTAPVEEPRPAKEEPKASKKPGSEAWRQQRLSGQRPILSTRWLTILFAAVAALFIPLGIAALVASRSVVEIRKNYVPEVCTSGSSTCSVTIEVEQDIKGPLMFYYEIENFYQNYRTFVRSTSEKQLSGKEVAPEADCGSLTNLEQRAPYYVPGLSAPVTFSGQCGADGTGCLSPCGIIAWSQFNDTFALFDAAGAPVPWDSSGVAGPWLKRKFKNRAACVDASGAFTRDPAVIAARGCFDVEDESFIVWMQTSALPSFRKLHRVLRDGLKAGTYRVAVGNWYPVEAFGGRKSLVFSTASWVGSRGDFLGIALIVMGSIAALCALFIATAHLCLPVRKPADPAAIKWAPHAD